MTKPNKKINIPASIEPMTWEQDNEPQQDGFGD